jgi:Isochorismate synthase
MVETVSLAGTLPKEEEWSSKEIHEQQVVTDYIVSNLKVAKNIRVDGPHTVDAGFFNHLKSYISAEVDSYDLVEQILNQLHPTPAVCGMPKRDAHDFIQQYEGYDRKFYAGYFGYKTPTESLYFVNLRCAQIFKKCCEIIRWRWDNA